MVAESKTARIRQDTSAHIEDTCALDVETKPVEWLWRGRIPGGKLTMFDGDPDLGKSVVTIDITARTTTGRAFPDGAPCEAGNVLVANVEDGADDTIVPRLKAHGADLECVFIFSGVPDGRGGTRLLELPQDIALLEDRVIKRQAVLLIIDPVMTMLGGDANKDQDARKALAPLRDMAERTGVAVICVRHLNKNISLSAIQRGGGNMGLIGVARAGSFFAHHPNEDGLRVMASHKSNLAQRPPSLAYRIVTSTVHDTARIEWKGVVDHDADSLAAGGISPHEKSELDAAQEFLRAELATGPMWAKQIFRDADDAGVTRKTLYRAKDALRVKSEKVGVEGWRWSLPPTSPEPPEGGRPQSDDHVDHVGHVQSRNGKHIENPAYLFEGGQGGQDGQGGQATLVEHVHGHLQQRHSQDVSSSAQKAATEGKGDGAPQPDNPSHSAKTAAEQGDSENDACRDDSLIKSEAQVFEMARAYFGLEPMQAKAGAA